MPEKEIGTCKKCGNIMTQICEANTRVIMGEVITLPGKLTGHKCKECGYEENISNFPANGGRKWIQKSQK